MNTVKTILLILLILIVLITIYVLFLRKDYDKRLLVVDNDIYHPLNYVYIFNNTLSKKFCNNIIKAGEETAAKIGGWTTKRHKSYATTDIPVKMFLNKNIINQLDTMFRTKIKPKIEKHYKIKLGNFGLNDHRDMFIVKYEYGEGSQDHLDFHRDGSVISYVIQLSEPYEYAQGGTTFETIGYTHTGKKGSLALHSGKVRHAGNKIISGKRYILVGFLDRDKSIINNNNTPFYNPMYFHLKHPYIVRNNQYIKDSDIINMIATRSLEEIVNKIKILLVQIKQYNPKEYSSVYTYYKKMFVHYGITI
jgi:hypothetical protein